jgi:hypothetical protein
MNSRGSDHRVQWLSVLGLLVVLERRVRMSRGQRDYELFFSNLPQGAFTASDVVALYLHRGAFEPVLADEDQEQATDRWCSHTAHRTGGMADHQSMGVERGSLELGHQIHPDSLHTTEFAPAHPLAQEKTADTPFPVQGYGPPDVASPWKQGRFSGRDFALQPDGTLRCPAGQTLRANERRKEGDGGLRVVYAASLRSCRPCPLREQCQWNGKATSKPRQVSVLLHPLASGNFSLLWRDWGRREHRHTCIQLVRDQHIEVRLVETPPSQSHAAPAVHTLAQRAHVRLPWTERLAHNARAPAEGPVSIRQLTSHHSAISSATTSLRNSWGDPRKSSSH